MKGSSLGADWATRGASSRRFNTSAAATGAAPLPSNARCSEASRPASARVSAALELGRRLAREGPLERLRINGPADVYARCAPALRDLRQEEFLVLLLNTQHAVMRELLVTRIGELA